MPQSTQGLPFRKAIMATAHKMVRAIFAMLKSDIYYRAIFFLFKPLIFLI